MIKKVKLNIKEFLLIKEVRPHQDVSPERKISLDAKDKLHMAKLPSGYSSSKVYQEGKICL